MLICSLFVAPTNSKENDKIKKMWEQIENVAFSGNQYEFLQKCNDLIQYAPWDNEYVYRGRIMLSDYYMQRADMVGIYEQYAYLRAYQEKQPDAELCEEYLSNLKMAYDTLVIMDKQKAIQEGLYFSNAFNKSGIPILAFEIKRLGNSYVAVIHPVCEFAKLMDMYKANGQPSYKTEAQSDILLETDGGNVFTAMWGSEKIRRANEDAARTWMEGGEEFRANMYGEMAKRDMPVGEMIGATIGTELGGALFDLISNLFATQKVTARTLGVKWIKEDPGVIKVHLDFFLETQKSGFSPVRKEVQYNMRMYKMYPHYEMLLRNSNGLNLSYKEEQNNKKMEKTNVVFYNNDIKRNWFEISKQNKAMYKRFALNNIFNPYLGKSRKKIYVPPTDELVVNFDDNQSLFFLSCWNKKLKCNDRFAAVLYDNGKITIGEMVNGLYNGKFLEFSSDGSYGDLSMVNGYINGRCILHNSDGKVYFDGNYSEGKKDGYGVETFLDGSVYKGMWESGEKNGEGMIVFPDGRSFSGDFVNNYPWSGKGTLKREENFFTGTLVNGSYTGECVIEYANGDVYNGQVESDLPNGDGSITYADVSKKPHVLKAKWKDGVPEVVQQKPTPRRKKGSRR